jgi:oligopeptide transport system ATP-binding protein
MAEDEVFGMTEPMIIEAENLKKHFRLASGATLKAVDGVSFGIERGHTLGLVGESGCGKSTVGRTILGMYEPTDGAVSFEGKKLFGMTRSEKRAFTRLGQMIFQDPYSSLDPRMTVSDIVGEGIDIHGIYKGKDRAERIRELLSLVGLAFEHAGRFPHEFSGGQRQRIGIARALAVEPSFIVCDEPISALDVSIQSQIVNLLMSLQERLSLTYLFISHDLGTVKYICERVAVMYLGVIVETAPSDKLYDEPRHPYTRALMSAIPIADPVRERAREHVILEGDVPSPIDENIGCRFAGRCPRALPKCEEESPELVASSDGHYVACWNVNERG